MKISKSIQLFLVAAVVSVIALTSCQEVEPLEETVNSETLSRTSPLTGLLERVAMSNTASDDIIDSTSCFQVDLPYQVIINDQLVTINSEDDLDTVESYFGGPVTGNTIDYVFPITVIFPDYSEIVVTSQQQYDALLADCEGSGDPIVSPIGCISIVYPITIFGYDSNFQLANTYTIDNDIELFGLIFNLSSSEYYAVDYPISIIDASGEVVPINNNIELLGAIQTAITDCIVTIDPCENPQILTDGLIIYMPFANEARDLVSMDLAIHNANYPPQFVADRDGTQNSAIAFGGDDLDFLKIDATDANNIETNDSITISLWFRMQNTTPGNLELPFHKSQGTSVQTNSFGVAIYDMNTPLFFSGIAVFNVWDGSWNSDPQLPTDTVNWHHLVITIATEATTNDAVHTVKLYRDGVLRASGTGSDFFINTQVFDYFLGSGFIGHLDDLRVYRKALTPEEVQTLYNIEGDDSICF